jgi:peptidyl-prolyl cis-trans isomerase C
LAIEEMEKMRKFCSLLMIMMLFSLAAGCKEKTETKEAARKAGPSEKTIVTVNGAPITLGDVNFRLRQSHHGAKLTPEVKKQAVDEMVTQELLYQEGLRLGLDKDPKYREMVMDMRRRMEAVQRAEMARRVFNSEIAARVTITADDAKKYYEKNAGKIRTELHLEQVRFRDEGAASKALERIKGGLSFEDLAREKYPEVKGGSRAPWDLGFVRWNQIPAEWLDDVYSLKKGQVSGIVRGEKTGIRIFKLLDSRENPEADFESMRSSITNRMRDEKIREAYDKYIEGLRGKATIEKGEGWALLKK